MKFIDFKVMIFDVVGMLIDFEIGVLNVICELGGLKVVVVSDYQIFEFYLCGCDKFYGWLFFVFCDVYLFIVEEIGFDSFEVVVNVFQLLVLCWFVFVDLVDVLVWLCKNFCFVVMINVDCIVFIVYEYMLGCLFYDVVICDEMGYVKFVLEFFVFNKGW